MQNLRAYLNQHNLFDKTKLEEHCERHLVKLNMSTKRPHLGILHYRSDVVFGKGKWTNFARACRGVVIDLKNKKLLAHPFNKFFNLGESHAPSAKDLAKHKHFSITEKLDGSFGIPFYDQETDSYIITTKGSLDSEHGVWATEHFPEVLKDKILLDQKTYMFEIIAKQFQIVVPYHRKEGYPEGLYLIGIRDNYSETLATTDQVLEAAKQFGFNTFKTYDYPSIDVVEEETKKLPYMDEGFVLRFDGETMVKIKSPEYLRVHRFVSNLGERNILDLMIEGEEKNILDNLGLVPEEYREDVKESVQKHQKEAYIFRDACYTFYSKAPKKTRKEFAVWVTRKGPGAPTSEMHKYMFGLYENRPVEIKAIYGTFRRRK